MSQSSSAADNAADRARRLWDEAAATFDDEPDHGLHPPHVRRAWRDLLAAWLPKAPAAVLDVGCGTGSLSVLMSELGHAVTGIDLSPEMIRIARAKADAHGRAVTFREMDAAAPQFAPQSFSTLVCRHVLWALPEPERALLRWQDLLQPHGRFVLVEGVWHTGAGLHVAGVLDALPASVSPVAVLNLGLRADYWGKHVNDERFAIIADCRP